MTRHYSLYWGYTKRPDGTRFYHIADTLDCLPPDLYGMWSGHRYTLHDLFTGVRKIVQQGSGVEVQVEHHYWATPEAS